jgi:hypothetical protein
MKRLNKQGGRALNFGLALGLALVMASTAVPTLAEELVGTPIATSTSAPALESSPPAERAAPPAAAEPAWVKQLSRELDSNFKPSGLINEAMDDSFMKDANWELLVPILGVIFIFGGPIFLACFLVLMHYRAKAQRQQIINTNIDKLLAAGRDIPLELLRGESIADPAHDSYLYKGIRNIALGLGLLAFLGLFLGIKIGSLGFIFIALGSSRVLVWKLAQRRASAAPALQD